MRVKKTYLPVIVIFLLLSGLNLLLFPKHNTVVAQGGTATPTLSCVQPTNADIAFAYCDATHNDIAHDYATPLADVSADKYIPPIILKAMGAQESRWTQCNADNTPFASESGCDWGIMQINSGMDCVAPTAQFDDETRQQVKYDYRYNIGMGTHILEQKWNWHQQNNRIIGDSSSDIAEHWYYAVWAYNKWTVDNSPNPQVNPCLLWPDELEGCSYQDKVWWWAAHPLTENGNPLWSAVDLTRPDDRGTFPATQQEMSTWTGWHIADPIPVHHDSCRDYLPVVMKDWDGCVTRQEWYPTGTVFCSQNTSNCNEANGKYDNVGAGPFNINTYLTLTFSPQRIQSGTTVGVRWRKYDGAYGNLYIDILLGNNWYAIDHSDFQGSPVWLWYNVNIGQYEGQYISGIKFRVNKSSQLTSMKYMVDGFRVDSFAYCGE